MNIQKYTFHIIFLFLVYFTWSTTSFAASCSLNATDDTFTMQWSAVTTGKVKCLQNSVWTSEVNIPASGHVSDSIEDYRWMNSTCTWTFNDGTSCSDSISVPTAQTSQSHDSNTNTYISSLQILSNFTRSYYCDSMSVNLQTKVGRFLDHVADVKIHKTTDEYDAFIFALSDRIEELQSRYPSNYMIRTIWGCLQDSLALHSQWTDVDYFLCETLWECNGNYVGSNTINSNTSANQNTSNTDTNTNTWSNTFIWTSTNTIIVNPYPNGYHQEIQLAENCYAYLYIDAQWNGSQKYADCSVSWARVFSGWSCSINSIKNSKSQVASCSWVHNFSSYWMYDYTQEGNGHYRLVFMKDGEYGYSMQNMSCRDKTVNDRVWSGCNSKHNAIGSIKYDGVKYYIYNTNLIQWKQVCSTGYRLPTQQELYNDYSRLNAPDVFDINHSHLFAAEPWKTARDYYLYEEYQGTYGRLIRCIKEYDLEDWLDSNPDLSKKHVLVGAGWREFESSSYVWDFISFDMWTDWQVVLEEGNTSHFILFPSGGWKSQQSLGVDQLNLKIKLKSGTNTLHTVSWAEDILEACIRDGDCD